MKKHRKTETKQAEGVKIDCAYDELVSVSELRPNPRNPNMHPDDQVAALAGLIKRLGWRAPVTVSRLSGLVVRGHGRLAAAKALGISDAPVDYQDYASEAEELADLWADNSIAELSSFDKKIEKMVFAEIADMLAGIEGLDSLMPGLKDVQVDDGSCPSIDEADALNKKWKVKRGDLFLVNEKHRLLCGDATVSADVERLLNGVEPPGMMVTDPPYGVEYDPAWRAKVNNDGPSSKRAVGKVENDDRADWTDSWRLFHGDVAYVWHAGRYSPVVASSLESVGLEARYLIVWAKQRHTFGRGHYHHQHEPCWYVVRKGATASWAGDQTQTTLWQIDNNRNNDTGHSTQKPVECMARPIRNHKFSSIYDPFLGSGTTMVAAEKLGRACYGIEVHPPYCAVSLQRMKDNFSGIKIERING